MCTDYSEEQGTCEDTTCQEWLQCGICLISKKIDENEVSERKWIEIGSRTRRDLCRKVQLELKELQLRLERRLQISFALWNWLKIECKRPPPAIMKLIDEERLINKTWKH